MIAWVVVSYENLAEVAELLVLHRGAVDEMFVVENGKFIDPVAQGILLRAGVKMVHLPANPGYLGALNVVSNQIPSGNVILSNADLLIAPGFFDELDKTLAASDAMMIAPSILTSEGVDQNPHFRSRPSLVYLLGTELMMSMPRVAGVWRQLKGRRRRGVVKMRESERIWAPHGSFFVFSAKFRELGGSWAYPCRLFAEEIWCGAEVERLGGWVDYTPSLQVWHSQNSTTGAAVRTGQIGRWQRESCTYWRRRAANGWRA